MKNYYEIKFDSLCVEYGVEKALEKIVENLLYQSSQPNTNHYKNKFDMFWKAKFIALLDDRWLNQENYILALSQWIRYTITDQQLCEILIAKNTNGFILAIRYSGIILNNEHDSWEVLNKLNGFLHNKKLDGFLKVVEKLQQEFLYRLKDYNEVKKSLDIGQVTAMIFSSLYAYEYLVPHKEIIDYIPYQYDENEDNSPETIWKAFEEIIKNSRKNKVVINEKMIFRTFEEKYFPIITGENLKKDIINDYELFKKMVAMEVELHNFKRNVLQSYSFNKKNDYFLKNNKLVYVSDVENDNWHIKNSIILAYWNHIGVLEYIKSDFFSASDTLSTNSDRDFGIISNIFGIIQQLKQVYGIDEININDKSIDIFDALLVQTSMKMHSQNEHINIYENLLASYDSYNAQMYMFVSGIQSQQCKLPLLFSTIQNRCSQQLSLLYGGSKKEKLKRINSVYEFWSCDLKLEADKVSFSYRPFFKIDDVIFQFPWMSAFQNINTSTVNYLRKLHKNRLELRKETDFIESRLGEKLHKVGFKVFSQYQPLDTEVGEIDLIAIYENHVIVAEVKSTYIKSSIQEIYEYRNFTLNKAAYQLSKKVAFVKKDFLNQFFENLDDVRIHSWIIDTTLEFDHHYFDNHLKISMDEIIISLNGKVDFMDSFENGSFDEESDVKNIDPLNFIKNIEKDEFWKHQIGNYDNFMNRMMSKLNA